MHGDVAIVGAGPGGIAAAKFLRDRGLEPVVFDQCGHPGGQWQHRNQMSGIWPGMATNTSRVMTHFSDLDYPAGTPAFPAESQVMRYLNDYVSTFGLHSALRLGRLVTGLEPDGAPGWTVHYRNPDGSLAAEYFRRVIVASGRFNQPSVPGIPGSTERVIHAHRYRGAGDFAGRTVLVAGGAISALEIASDLAMRGAARVICCYRRQRYILGKLAQGVPTDHINFSLFEALAGERLPASDNAARLKAFVLATEGSPESYGAKLPSDDLGVAGVTKSEHFLPMVAAGRIAVQDWPDRIDDHLVRFPDGSHEAVDQVILGTGYRLALPFLDEGSRRKLALDAEHVALYKHTFHPDLPNLAVLGFYNQVGPYFPVLELQARWIASVFAGITAMPDEAEMRAGLEAYFKTWQQPQKMPMHQLALLFARAIGAEPDPDDWPGMRRALLFGPLSATVFRLGGLEPLPEAAATVSREARAFGMITDEIFTEAERAHLALIGVSAAR